MDGPSRTLATALHQVYGAFDPNRLPEAERYLQRVSHGMTSGNAVLDEVYTHKYPEALRNLIAINIIRYSTAIGLVDDDNEYNATQHILTDGATTHLFSTREPTAEELSPVAINQVFNVCCGEYVEVVAYFSRLSVRLGYGELHPYTCLPLNANAARAVVAREVYLSHCQGTDLFLDLTALIKERLQPGAAASLDEGVRSVCEEIGRASPEGSRIAKVWRYLQLRDASRCGEALCILRQHGGNVERALLEVEEASPNTLRGDLYDLYTRMGVAPAELEGRVQGAMSLRNVLVSAGRSHGHGEMTNGARAQGVGPLSPEDPDAAVLRIVMETLHEPRQMTLALPRQQHSGRAASTRTPAAEPQRSQPLAAAMVGPGGDYFFEDVSAVPVTPSPPGHHHGHPHPHHHVDTQLHFSGASPHQRGHQANTSTDVSWYHGTPAQHGAQGHRSASATPSTATSAGHGSAARHHDEEFQRQRAALERERHHLQLQYEQNILLMQKERLKLEEEKHEVERKQSALWYTEMQGAASDAAADVAKKTPSEKGSSASPPQRKTPLSPPSGGAVERSPYNSPPRPVSISFGNLDRDTLRRVAEIEQMTKATTLHQKAGGRMSSADIHNNLADMRHSLSRLALLSPSLSTAHGGGSHLSGSQRRLSPSSSRHSLSPRGDTNKL